MNKRSKKFKDETLPIQQPENTSVTSSDDDPSQIEVRAPCESTNLSEKEQNQAPENATSDLQNPSSPEKTLKDLPVKKKKYSIEV